MILVTGAGGKTGKAVIGALTKRGQEVRALVKSTSARNSMIASGASEFIIGDLRDKELLNKATENIQAVYHICPNMSPDEITIGQIAIEAAKKSSVSHFVYHSVLHPQVEAMSHHWSKLRVEETLLSSGLNFTILQPAPYMQNILAQWEQIVNHNQYPIPYAISTRLGMVDLDDVAEVAAIVLTQPGHIGSIYELAGPEIMSQEEVTNSIGKIVNRPVKAREIPRRLWEQNARQAGLNDYALQTLLKMFEYYEKYGFYGNSNILQWLLERTPTSFSAFIHRVIKTNGFNNLL